VQIERYGYAAFSFTIIPYLMMSFLNMLALLSQPIYPAIYPVQLDLENPADAEATSPTPNGSTITTRPQLGSQTSKSSGEGTTSAKEDSTDQSSEISHIDPRLALLGVVGVVRPPLYAFSGTAERNTPWYRKDAPINDKGTSTGDGTVNDVNKETSIQSEIVGSVPFPCASVASVKTNHLVSYIYHCTWLQYSLRF
jgi:hypothetical protein